MTISLAIFADAAGGAEPGYPGAWVPVAMLLAIAAVFAVGILALSAWLGRSRTGPVKESPFEAGIVPTDNAQRPFHVRYYVIALIFLLFDVEVVLLFPWAVIFGGGQSGGAHRDGAMLAEMFLFLLILLVGYIYAWRKGVLRFD